ncbi:hypothetical protein LC607_30175 [Nostoc sp. CHAB 5824]|nr:hypothetical protein [Nostoc sp. CHAB 5824]
MLKLEVASVTVSDRLQGFLIIMRSRGWKNKPNILSCYEHRRRATARQTSQPTPSLTSTATLNLMSPQNLLSCPPPKILNSQKM